MELLTLPDGKKIPQLGFGTAGIGNHEKTREIIQHALRVGYRRFDTASMYGNEKAIGDAIREVIATSDLSREDIFVTTKLWDGGNFSYENTMKEAKKSLEKLGLDYIDLYLHHWPVAGQRLESWKAMEELVDDGIISYIGVSNYTIAHLQELLDHAEVMPVLNQVEFNPFLFQNDLMEYCKDNQIILEAYSPLVQGKKLSDPVLTEIAKRYNKSPAQVLIRWGIDLGISTIPKTSTKQYVEQNFDVFDFSLSEEDMNKLEEMDQDLRLEWDPTDVR